MKILIIQEQAHNPKVYSFREAASFKRAFERMGIESVIWGLNYENYNIPFNEISRDCDVVFLIEQYGGWIPDMTSFTGIKLFWSIDSHCVPSYHSMICNNNKIDIVLNSIESHSKYFNQACFYFPNAYASDIIFPKDDIIKDIDIGFCGHIGGDRPEWINSIPNIKTMIEVIGDDMVNSINSYQIHFNRNLADDINYRTFETLGCRTLLFTNFTENLDNLFDIDKHLVVYDTKADLLDKMRYYLDNTTILTEISNAGYLHVKQFHTYDNRAKLLLDILKK